MLSELSYEDEKHSRPVLSSLLLNRLCNMMLKNHINYSMYYSYIILFYEWHLCSLTTRHIECALEKLVSD